MSDNISTWLDDHGRRPLYGLNHRRCDGTQRAGVLWSLLRLGSNTVRL